MSGRTMKACELIGEEGQFRLPGGRTIYTNVMYDCATARSDRPRMARLVSKQINRWVDWDQEVEVLSHEADLNIGDKCPSCGGELVDGGGPEAVICRRCRDEWPTEP
jgi:hypothetical protein